ncbi:MAG: hypothetical protein U1F98_06455 [Verrucomicrobiota bacterium]
MEQPRVLRIFALALLLAASGPGRSCAEPAGLFIDSTDVGNPGKPGKTEFEESRQAYQVSGGGENMWFTNDSFHMVWTKMSGDLSLAATIRWIGSEGNAHRKACLIIRQSLDNDSPYVDAALHGNGLTSLQYREIPGGVTREIQSALTGPSRLRIEKHGAYVSMSVALPGEKLHPAGGAFRIAFTSPFYVGLAVCAHDNSRLEKAEFTAVELNTLPAPAAGQKLPLASTLEIVPISSADRRVILYSTEKLEAPNWSRDGQFLLFNRLQRICKMAVKGGPVQVLDTAPLVHCSSHHGISPDGSQLALSDLGDGGQSRIYVMSFADRKPALVTSAAPSFWHGWSPDGRLLVYAAERQDRQDVYTIPVEGGAERRLTADAGRNDGPDFSPDGRFIYFESDRGGSWQIWRMKADGSDPVQVTTDEFNNCSPHPSPDGKWIAYLSWPKGGRVLPLNKDVQLRLMSLRTGQVQVLANFLGGQGSLDVPSWSPDSERLAFVSYQPIYP